MTKKQQTDHSRRPTAKIKPQAAEKKVLSRQNFFPDAQDFSECQDFQCVRRSVAKGAQLLPEDGGTRSFVAFTKKSLGVQEGCETLFARAELHDLYADMCRLAGHEPIGRNTFYQELRLLGYIEKTMALTVNGRAATTEAIDLGQPLGLTVFVGEESAPSGLGAFGRRLLAKAAVA